MKLYRKKRIEIVADATMKDALAALILECGAKGYTLVPKVSGQGSRGVRDASDIFDVFTNVQFIVVVSEEVADRIVQESMQLLDKRPRMVLVSDVDVVRDDHF